MDDDRQFEVSTVTVYTPEPDEPSAAESEDPGYVPMSEWLDDFDRR